MKLSRFLDKLEDKVRIFLSRYPVLYGLIAGIGLVLFWRGVWHTTDAVAEFVWGGVDLHTTIDLAGPFWDGPISFVLGSVILLLCGVFVSELLGNEIIISGLRGEKKLTEKTEVEVRTETGAIGEIRHDMHMILQRLEAIEKKLGKKK